MSRVIETPTARTAPDRSPLLVLALLALALAIGLAGMATLPPDEHEILVLRSAHEMQARGDWIVPYFNDQPRLKKPPLSYWLTGLTAYVSGARGAVLAWHGRLPSLLAGLAMAAMVLWGGQRFYGNRAALYATGLFVTSVGFFTYAHDGRPDFLYAALCTGGWLAGAVGLVEARGARAWPIVSMWLAFAVATLAKGPHVPFMLLVAMALYCVTRRPRGVLAARSLRPLLGLALVSLVTLPWWWALHARLDPSAVRGSQLAGRLLVPRLDHLLNGYYLYRPLQLLLPWLPLAPLAWLAAARDAGEGRPLSVFLGFCVAAVALGLSFGGQQRFFYMLPVLPALCLLAGHGLARLETTHRSLATALCALQLLLIAGGSAWLFGSQHLPVLLGAVTASALIVGWLVRRRLESFAAGGLAAAMVLTAASFIRFADGHVLWSIDRFNRHALAHAVATRVEPTAPLMSFALTPVIYIQVTGRAIPEFDSPASLEQALHERHLQQAYVLALTKRIAELAKRFNITPVVSMPNNANDRAGLYRITPLSH